MCPSLIFSVGPFSVSICSVIGASPSILAPMFVLLSLFGNAAGAIFGSCGFWDTDYYKLIHNTDYHNPIGIQTGYYFKVCHVQFFFICCIYKTIIRILLFMCYKLLEFNFHS